MPRSKVVSTSVDGLTSKPKRRFGRKKRKQSDYTAFIIGAPKTPESAAIDAKLIRIFQELNQTESSRFHSPYRDFLAEKIHKARLQTDQSLSAGAPASNWTVTLTRK